MPSDKEARDAAYIRMLEDMVDDLREEVSAERRHVAQLTHFVVVSREIVRAVARYGVGGFMPAEYVSKARQLLEEAKQPG